MKSHKLRLGFILMFLFISSLSFSQSIKKPGETAIISMGDRIIRKDLVGSYELSFSGNQGPGSNVPYITREEINASGSGIGSFDKLDTHYSGKIYSVNKQGEEQVFIEFQDKTPEQLSRMEIEISPNGNSGNLPPNIHGIIASSLAQVKREFGPIVGYQIFGQIINSIAPLPRDNCEQYFNSVFQVIDNIKSNSSQDYFPDEVYNRIIEVITEIRNNHCNMGYDLYLHLEAKVTSKSIEHELSDDSGVYSSLIKVNLTPIH